LQWQWPRRLPDDFFYCSNYIVFTHKNSEKIKSFKKIPTRNQYFCIFFMRQENMRAILGEITQGWHHGFENPNQIVARIFLLIWRRGSFHQNFRKWKLEFTPSTALLNILGFSENFIFKNEKIFAFLCCNFFVCNQTTVKHVVVQ
jgi:hypothetical protein